MYKKKAVQAGLVLLGLLILSGCGKKREKEEEVKAQAKETAGIAVDKKKTYRFVQDGAYAPGAQILPGCQ